MVLSGNWNLFLNLLMCFSFKTHLFKGKWKGFRSEDNEGLDVAVSISIPMGLPLDNKPIFS